MSCLPKHTISKSVLNFKKINLHTWQYMVDKFTAAIDDKNHAIGIFSCVFFSKEGAGTAKLIGLLLILFIFS